MLAASSHAAVTNARATGDYFHAFEQWAVGGTSLFYWAIGILPFKDGFYSSNNKQVGGQTVGPEKDPDREALMATLSCAMVGPMDGIELLNASRVMTSCRKDGVLLKPDKPLATSESCFRSANPTCHVYHTFSDVVLANASSSFRAHYIFSNDVEPLTADMLYHPSAAARHLYYNWYTGAAGVFESSNALAAGYEGHIFAMVVPELANGWTLLGEIEKYVPLSRKRVSGVQLSGQNMYVTLAGVPGEDVNVCALRSSGAASGFARVCHNVHFDSAKQLQVAFVPSAHALA